MSSEATLEANDPLADNIKQSHDYVRHIIQMFLTWFSVFATVNYAAMGWLATIWVSSGAKLSPAMVWVISTMFVAQNILAILGTWEVWKAIERQIKAVSQIGNTVPQVFYFSALRLFAIALALTAIAWIAIGWFLYSKLPG